MVRELVKYYITYEPKRGEIVSKGKDVLLSKSKIESEVLSGAETLMALKNHMFQLAEENVLLEQNLEKANAEIARFQHHAASSAATSIEKPEKVEPSVLEKPAKTNK